MSDFASVVEQARRAFASVARLESALTRDPTNPALQVNLSACKKLARKSEDQLRAFSEYQRIDLCNYRLIPHNDRAYKLQSVSKSLLEYQNLFSQIYDALKNGAKGRAQIGMEAASESAMELAYTYSGSLGFALVAHSDRDFFEGRLDKSIDVLFEIISVNNRSAIREVASSYGASVVKRLYDWSKANLDGHFAADVLWSRSDGRKVGRIVEEDILSDIVNLIAFSGDEQSKIDYVAGRLIGGDLRSGSFHFVVPNGTDYRGAISSSFSADAEMTLGKEYAARILVKSKTIYATDKVEIRYELEALWEPGKFSELRIDGSAT